MNEYAIETYKDVLTGRIKRFPRDFWKDDRNKNYSDSAAITRYLIEDILKWDDETVKQKICCKVFFDNKLKGMLTMLFGDSVYAALENAYPGKFKQWQLSCTPRNFWNTYTAKQATIWLFKEHLKLTDDEILKSNSRKIFVENGLDTMMHVIFNNNASKAIQNAFPELFGNDLM